MKEFIYNSQVDSDEGMVGVFKEERTIQIKIDNEETSQKVPFKTLSNLFFYIQNTFEELGNYFSGEGFKDFGPTKKTIRELVELSLVDTHKGSVVIEAEIPPIYQKTLTDEKPLSIVVLDGFNEIIEEIETAEDLGRGVGEIVRDERHKTKILTSIQGFWPQQNAQYKLSIKTAERPYSPLTKERRVVLDSYLEGERRDDEEELIGPLTSLSIVPPLTFEIGKKPKLKCRFASEIEDLAKRNIGKIVQIRGRATIPKKGRDKIYENVHVLKPVEEIFFDKIHWKKHVLEFKEPLVTQVDFIEKMVVLKNEEYDILIISEGWEDGIREFNEYFMFLWEEYVLAPDEELTKDAIELKKKLNELVVKST